MPNSCEATIVIDRNNKKTIIADNEEEYQQKTADMREKGYLEIKKILGIFIPISTET